MALPELNYVMSTDDIADDDEIELRVQLPCGHKAAPNSVMKWCLSRLELGETKLQCPALANDGTSCGNEWTLAVIRDVIINSEEGLKGFRELEEKLATITAKHCCDYKECPGCKSLVERRDEGNVRVYCTICTAAKGSIYEFCWQCLQPWEGDGKSSMGCARKECKDSYLEILQKCKDIELPNSQIQSCPSIRACPTCGLLIEHKEMCKYVVCHLCKVEFCFVCLETARVCQVTKPCANYMPCAKPVAPKQTVIPVWSMRK